MMDASDCWPMIYDGRPLAGTGVSEPVATTITGHRTSSMFHRYNVTTADDKVEAMAALDGPKNSGPRAPLIRMVAKRLPNPKKPMPPAHP